MKVLGLQKLTLLDYPGYVACTIFTGGCNFKCPFCQNTSLVNYDEKDLGENNILEFLRQRKPYLDAVCISGGEPTIQKDLKDFIKKVKKLGYLIKLDTNGTNPTLIKELIEDKLIDYVAMDIKNSKEKYNQTIGLNYDINLIEKSINLLLENTMDYEFRTTVVKDFHDDDDFKKIACWIKGAKKYVLQQFVDSDNVMQGGLSSHPKEKLFEFKKILELELKNIEIRGV